MQRVFFPDESVKETTANDQKQRIGLLVKKEEKRSML